MKIVILLINCLIAILGLAALGAVFSNPNPYFVGKMMFFVAIMTMILWVTGNLIMRKSPSTYLPNVVICIGLWMSASSLFTFLSAYYGQSVDMSLVQVIGEFIGGFLIVLIGYKKKRPL